MKYKRLMMVGAMTVAVSACGTIDPAKVAKIDPTGKGVFIGKVMYITDAIYDRACSTFGEDERCVTPPTHKGAYVCCRSLNSDPGFSFKTDPAIFA